jgi:uncharacterized protein DUF1573
MRFFTKAAWGIIALRVLALSAGALDWKSTAITVTTAPFQTEQDVIFEFTNRGSKPVTIREVETSCACLLAVPDQKIYAPGASGKVTAKFTVGDRGGTYERTVVVLTDEPDSPSRLTLTIEVPSVASAIPRSVSWHMNEEPLEKYVELSVSRGLDIDFARAEPTSDVFAVRIENIEAGKRYRLHIRPLTTATLASAAIRLFGADKSGHEVVLSAYAGVR